MNKCEIPSCPNIPVEGRLCQEHDEMRKVVEWMKADAADVDEPVDTDEPTTVDVTGIDTPSITSKKKAK